MQKLDITRLSTRKIHRQSTLIFYMVLNSEGLRLVILVIACSILFMVLYIARENKHCTLIDRSGRFGRWGSLVFIFRVVACSAPRKTIYIRHYLKLMMPMLFII